MHHPTQLELYKLLMGVCQHGKKTILMNIDNIEPAAKPGLHSSFSSISKEYSSQIVSQRLNFLKSSISWNKKKSC